MPGGVITAIKYRFSTVDALRHPVISLQALFSSGSRLCADLSHTGQAYSATEQQSARAVILIVLAFVPHLDVENLGLFPVEHLDTSNGLHFPIPFRSRLHRIPSFPPCFFRGNAVTCVLSGFARRLLFL